MDVMQWTCVKESNSRGVVEHYIFFFVLLKKDFFQFLFYFFNIHGYPWISRVYKYPRIVAYAGSQDGHGRVF